MAYDLSLNKSCALANIAKHPNTPIEVVRDLAGRKDVAGGATTPAKYRLEKLERANKNQ